MNKDAYANDHVGGRDRVGVGGDGVVGVCVVGVLRHLHHHLLLHHHPLIGVLSSTPQRGRATQAKRHPTVRTARIQEQQEQQQACADTQPMDRHRRGQEGFRSTGLAMHRCMLQPAGSLGLELKEDEAGEGFFVRRVLQGGPAATFVEVPPSLLASGTGYAK
eukprot:2984389-Rhodomonas_salina.1